jgi:hypothetical protein
VTWPVRFDRNRIDLEVPDRISTSDAHRQEATAEEILRRLEDQPGVVLADEVGMGKTFVALAVAAHAAWGDEGRNPVVVMVPSSLRDKWPRDFRTFKSKCLKGPNAGKWDALEAGSADEGVEFLKMLDDPISRRKRIIFLSHGALYRGLQDPWTKLAIIQAALHGRRLSRQRDAFPKFAGKVLRVDGQTPEALFRDLLAVRPEDWRAVMTRHGEDPVDDPVPAAIRRVLGQGHVDLSQLKMGLEGLPIFSSVNLDERVKAVRQDLTGPLREVWTQSLRAAKFRSPLLILDEAHHLKNPATELASLFVEAGTDEDVTRLQAALQGRFERMLFLTATPFQLGHRELLNVLDRFRGIAWRDGSPRMEKETFSASMTSLASAMDDAQRSTLELDERWQSLRAGDIDGEVESGGWWEAGKADETQQAGSVGLVRRLFDVADVKMRAAERLLQPWVIRHLRSRQLPDSSRARREVLTGAAILGGAQKSSGGLAIDRGALLPFLLAARTQALVSSRSTGALADRVRRATFAEGLASSFEAYLETREAALDGNDLVVDEALIDPGEAAEDRHLRRYLDHLTEVLPDESARGRHPKIEATVNRVAALWLKGEKVLVFCHFRATGRALTAHISRRLEALIQEEGARKMGCSKDQVRRRLAALSGAFDKDRPARRRLDESIERWLAPYPALGDEHRRLIAEVVVRFVRTESFLVRYFPLAEGDAEQRLEEALAGKDESGLSLETKLCALLKFLADRCEADEREEYLEALGEIQTGLLYVRAEEGGDVREGTRQLATVRRAAGGVKYETRRRLLLAFNTPFFPEVLVASSVLAEGVDLHLDCRHVIHHDLCWNPSTLEQRTGRVDRIGAKAEKVGQPINVYLPYVGGTQDEKMFRVVRDRERWFQVVMGEKFALDESRTDKLAERVPLPETAARTLAFRLEVVPASRAPIADARERRGDSRIERVPSEASSSTIPTP